MRPMQPASSQHNTRFSHSLSRPAAPAGAFRPHFSPVARPEFGTAGPSGASHKTVSASTGNRPGWHRRANKVGNTGSCNMGARRALCPRCARAVRKVGYFGPVSPDGQRDRSTYCVPIRRTAQMPTQSKTQIMSSNKPYFPTTNARLLSKSAVCALWTQPARWGVGAQGGHGKAI